MKLGLRRVAAVLVLLASSLLVQPSAAQAYFNTEWNVKVVQNVATGACLDDSSLGVRAVGCNNMEYQHWQFNYETNGNNPFELINRRTGGCLDDSFEYGLRVTRCNGWWGGHQAWTITRYDGNDAYGLYEFRNNATGRCLDDSHLGLRTVTCNGGWGGYQLWRLSSV